MKVIYKYVLDPGKICQFQVPCDRALAKVGRDPTTGYPAIWFIVDKTSPTQECKYMVFGTGQEWTGSVSHVGTAIGGMFVWHVF